MIIDGGRLEGGQGSSVVEAGRDDIRIIREGIVSASELSGFIK